MRKKWKFAEIDKETAKMLANECDADEFVALLCTARGCTTPEALEEFISLEPMFESVYDFRDMDKAADTILEAIDNADKITVFGDYDCDGVTATALLVKSLNYLGAKVDYKIPDRIKEGYGITVSAVDELYKSGTKLIITVDNGINAVAAADRARELGIKLVITDHHLPQSELPVADAVVDPHREDCFSVFKDIAGVGVAFRLACALEDATPEELLYKYADLLCIGTVADVMPLISENRTAVAEGVRMLAAGSNIGINALASAAGFTEDKELNASAVAFVISPRINAAGRLGDASRAVELLLTDDGAVASAISEQINYENSRRQAIEQKIYNEAVAQIESKGYYRDRVIVVSGENWHRGIVGISAAKLCEKYAKPVIVLSVEGEYAIGSGRSLEGFNLFDAISSASYMLEKFGGHSLAAGVTIRTELVESFRRIINEYAAEREMPFPEITIDCKLHPSALNFDLLDAVSSMEPFGQGNKQPIFAVMGVKIQKIIPLSQGKHLRVHFGKDFSVFVGLCFSMTPDAFAFSVGDIVDVALTVSGGYYNGERQLNLQVKDIRPSGTDQDKQFESLEKYNCYISDGAVSDIISLNRDIVGKVYRSVGDIPQNAQKICYRIENELGCGRIFAAFDCLEELGLIVSSVSGNTKMYKRNSSAGRKELDNSEIYRDLKEGM